MTTAKNLIPKSKARTAYGLLSDVRRVILAEPKRYRQSWWVERGQEGMVFPACGTRACVAGWAMLLKKPTADLATIVHTTQALLGLSDQQAETLFSASAVDGPVGTLEYAKRGAAHIARFQKRYAKQLKATAV